MSAIIARIKGEPAVVIGILFSAVLGGVQYASGHGVITSDLVTTIQNALDPQSGWALPIVVGIITRFFVSPAAKVGV